MEHAQNRSRGNFDMLPESLIAGIVSFLLIKERTIFLMSVARSFQDDLLKPTYPNGCLGNSELSLKQLNNIFSIGSLKIIDSVFNDSDLESLREAKNIHTLTLHRDSKVSQKGLQSIMHLHSLRYLTLYNADNLVDISCLRFLSNLKHLILFGNNKHITDEQIIKLIPHLNHLTKLDLRGCSLLTDECMPSLSQLHSLDVFGCPPNITDEGMKNYIRNIYPAWPKIICLLLSSNNLTARPSFDFGSNRVARGELSVYFEDLYRTIIRSKEQQREQNMSLNRQMDAKINPAQDQQGSTPVPASAPALFQSVPRIPGTTQAAPQTVAPTRGQMREEKTDSSSVACCVMQ